jgi:hypothetical protein
MTTTGESTHAANDEALLARTIDKLRAGAFKARAGCMTRVVSGLRDVAPYAALELLLPGGSLMALLLWLYRRHKRGNPLGASAR